MFEHVGLAAYDEFFATVRRQLKDDGVMVLHSIGRSEGPSATNPWIRKYIFPGGYIPSASETMAAIERSGLYVTDIEILRLHYADTLKEWRRRFHAHRDEVKAIYDERFCRMWEFYLAGSEVAFRVYGHMVFHIQLAKRQDVVPRTRDYVGEREAQLRKRESQQGAVWRRGELRGEGNPLSLPQGDCPTASASTHSLGFGFPVSRPAGHPFPAKPLAIASEKGIERPTFPYAVGAKIADGLTQFAPGHNVDRLRIVNQGQRPDDPLRSPTSFVAVVEFHFPFVTNGPSDQGQVDPRRRGGHGSPGMKRARFERLEQCGRNYGGDLPTNSFRRRLQFTVAGSL